MRIQSGRIQWDDHKGRIPLWLSTLLALTVLATTIVLTTERANATIEWSSASTAAVKPETIDHPQTNGFTTIGTSPAFTSEKCRSHTMSLYGGTVRICLEVGWQPNVIAWTYWEVTYDQSNYLRSYVWQRRNSPLGHTKYRTNKRRVINTRIDETDTLINPAHCWSVISPYKIELASYPDVENKKLTIREPGC